MHSEIRIDWILETCPLLTHLHAGMIGVVTELLGPWVPECKPTQQRQHTSSLLLQSFVFENACFIYSSLDNLLGACPGLKELRFINISFINSAKATTTTTTVTTTSRSSILSTSHDYNQLTCRMEELRLQLRVFHVSIYGVSISDGDLQRLSEICPTSSEWTFWTPNLTPAMSQHLDVMFNNSNTRPSLEWG